MTRRRRGPSCAPDSEKHGFLSRNRHLAFVVGAFAVSRLVYYVSGIRYDSSPLPWFWQYVDPELLRTAFGQSIFYLHSQPPLMNVFLGVVVNLFPSTMTTVFWLVYLLLGLVLTTGLWKLMTAVGVSETLATSLTILFCVSPPCVLYENWLFYAYPTATSLVLAALFWFRFVKETRTRDAVILFACLAVPALTWSVFHLAWFCAAVVGLTLLKPGGRRRTIVAAAVPLLLVTLWYSKNLALFGQFTPSTWSGMNFSKMTNGMLNPEERNRLYAQGVITRASLLPPFGAVGQYESLMVLPGPTGIPVLDQREKPSRVPNYNNKAYIAVARQVGRDAGRILSAMPRAYVRGLTISYLTFFMPAEAYPFLAGNRKHIAGFSRLFSIIFEGRFFYRLDRELLRTARSRFYLQNLLNTGFWLVVAYAASLAFGLLLLIGRVRQASPSDMTVLFLWFNILFAMLAGNGIEVGENNRFRFVLDPLVLVMTGVLLQQALSRRSVRDTARQQRL